MNVSLTAIFRRSGGGEGGFTLIELLVSILLFSVIMAAVFSFLWGAVSYWEAGQDAADVTENARMGLNRMSREIKQSSLATVAEAGRMTFRVDFGDGSGVQWITYQYNSDLRAIQRSICPTEDCDGGPWETLLSDVQSILFEYYGNDYRCDANGDGLIKKEEMEAAGCSGGLLANISQVDITLAMQSGNDAAQTFFGQAWLRNRNTVGGA